GFVGDGTARIAALLAMAAPSLILWSAVGVRDAPIHLCLMIGMAAACRLESQARLPMLVVACLSVGILTGLRPHVGVIVGLGVIAGTLRRPSIPRVAGLAFLVVGVGTAIAAAGQGFLGYEHIVQEWGLQALATKRMDLATGGDSSYMAHVNIANPGELVRFLPIAIFYFFFSPFPWEATRSSLALMSLPESLCWYTLLPAAAVGTAMLLRSRPPGIATLAIVMTCLGIVYTLLEGNVGTLYRHRVQFQLLALVPIAAGLGRFLGPRFAFCRET
ncbi:MAG: hypothetical protein CME06_15235, partial [Gemmatimonadetes bacterium]|nr:hypothetical protein [Gemmatimonadota bacterium]